MREPEPSRPAPAVKLLTEEEICRLGNHMMLPAEDAERVQKALRWGSRALAWLSKDGEHAMTCDADCRRTKCTCGLTTLLAEIEEP